MPYKPYSQNQEQREAHFGLVWFGALLNLMLVAFLLLGLTSRYTEGWLGFVVGTYTLLAVFVKFDDYAKSLIFEGFRWAAAVFAIWLSAQALVGIFEGYYAGGVSAGGSMVDADDQTFLLPAAFNRAFLLGACCTLAFHAGFLFNHLRNRA